MGFVKKSAMLSVVPCTHERDLEFEGLDHVTNEEVSPLDVLHPIVVLGVVRDVARMRALSANPWRRTTRLGFAEADCART